MVSSRTHNLLFEHLQDRYTFQSELGRGNMGVVYLAYDDRMGREVAIKTLDTLALKDPSVASEMVERFRREAKTLARISHPHLVTLFEIGSHQSQHYMVMEYVKGSPLSRFVAARQKLSSTLVASIGKQMCDALERIHQEQIIHRDIKPANMILSEKGVVKLTDFGVARCHRNNDTRLTQAGALMGTLLYCAPEQIQNASTVDARADIYALGMSLYELLSHQSPYRGRHIAQVALEITSDQPTSGTLKTHVPDLPDSLVHIIEKALAKNPEDRFPDARSMGEVLDLFIQRHLTQKKIHFC